MCWKSADTDWAYAGKLQELDKTKRLAVIFLEGEEKEGAVYLDNLRFQ